MKQFFTKDTRPTGHYNRNLIQIITLFTIILLAFAAGGVKRAEASTAVTPVPTAGSVVVTVDLLEETAAVTAGVGGSTKFYVSKDKKTWELIEPGTILDITPFLSTKAVTLYFKGNKETTIVESVLPAQDGSLQAAYSVLNGEGRIQLSGTSLPIEYRKSAYGQWKTLASPLFMTASYETYGSTLYFRITATTTRRAGKIVSVKVPKRPTAPTVKLDGSRLYISGIKVGETQYRAYDSIQWLDFPTTDSKLKTYDLKDILAPNTAITILPAGTMEFRTKATDKKIASSVKVIEVPAQPVAPENIIITGSTLTCQDANKKKYYEYTRVAATETLNIKTAKWTAFTSAKPVIIKGANVTDKIYVRAKSYTDSTTKQIVLASVVKELVVASLTTTP